MNEYWLNHFNFNAEHFVDSQLKQVGKTINGCEVDQDQVCLIIETIKNHLALSKNDSVIDLCCGNGLLTARIARFCKRVVGVDFSEKMIAIGRKTNIVPNIKYFVSDVIALEWNRFRGYSKLCIYEGIQHLTVEEFRQLLRAIRENIDNPTIFIGGVPDKQKLNQYYDTDEKIAFFLDREARGISHMGRWWDQSEIEAVGKELGMQTCFHAQHSTLYSAYYRFDCVLEQIK